MTLGLNKTNVFIDDFEKNVSKKRKLDKGMNGLSEENIKTINFNNSFNLNERSEENNYETPSKRSRSMASNNCNPITTNEKRRFSLNNLSNNLNPMLYFHNIWSKIKGKSDTKPELPSIETIDTNDSTDLRMASNNSSIETIDLINANESVVSKPNSTNNTNESLISSQTSNSLIKRKRRFNTFRYSDKQRYRELLNRHMNFNFVFNNKKSIKTPEVIDLSSSLSSRPNNPLTNSQFSKSSQLSHSTDEHFKREVLDSNTQINLVERIKSAGIVGQTSIKSNSTPFCPNTSRNINVFSTPIEPKTQTKTIQLFKGFESTPLSLPESSKIFNTLVKDNKTFLKPNWISDLRNSLTQSNEKLYEKILKSEQKVLETKNKREIDYQNLSPIIRKAYTRTELLPFVPFVEILELEDIEEQEEDVDEEEIFPSDLPNLTPEMDKQIDNALRPTPPNEVLSEAFSVQICRKDMETLKGLNWLNDEIINFYLSLIVERGKNDNFSTVYAFNTFFYKKLKDNGPQSLKRWTRKVNIFENDFIFIPIHLGMHWCLAVIDFLNKRIQYYDSMGGQNMECVNLLKKYLQSESIDKRKVEFPMTDWTLQMVKDIPQQMNGSDCGMFSCKYAEYISRKAKINFTQAHMPYFRRRMVYEILTKKLL